jgi:hypothetical protein
MIAAVTVTDDSSSDSDSNGSRTAYGGDQQWEVSKVVGKRVRGGGHQYDVVWKGSGQHSWEPADSIRTQIPNLVRDYEERKTDN